MGRPGRSVLREVGPVLSRHQVWYGFAAYMALRAGFERFFSTAIAHTTYYGTMEILSRRTPRFDG